MFSFETLKNLCYARYFKTYLAYPLRQLSRLTGVSYGVIQRINGKMKLGQ